MIDEKELIKKVRESFKDKKSTSEITRNLQAKGYKLEYINEIIKRAKPKTKLFYASIITILILISITAFLSYNLFSQTNEKQNMENPLKNLNINFGQKQQLSNETETYLEDIEITPEFITYLLNEIGAWELRKNPLTSEPPKINFKVDEKEFNSKITNKITTTTGLLDDADIQFNSDKESTIKAMLSENPAEIFKESFQTEKTTIQVIAEESELFAKGYLNLYDKLK